MAWAPLGSWSHEAGETSLTQAYGYIGCCSGGSTHCTGSDAPCWRTHCQKRMVHGRPSFNVLLVVALLFNSFLFLCAQDIFAVWGAKAKPCPAPYLINALGKRLVLYDHTVHVCVCMRIQCGTCLSSHP